MAEAGFYWHGTETEIDIAACFVCGKELDGWEESDDPWSEHRKHAPQCPFVKFGRPETHLTVMDGKCYWLNDEEKIKLTDITFPLNLQCDEFVTIMMATVKTRYVNNYTTLKTNGKLLIEKKRKEMEKLLRTN